MASVDSDKCVTVDIKHDDKLEGQPAFLQVLSNVRLHFSKSLQAALLYTSISGQRRLRIHNLSLINGENHGQLYRHADVDAVVLTLFKQGASGYEANAYTNLYSRAHDTREDAERRARIYYCTLRANTRRVQREVLGKCTRWTVDSARGFETLATVCQLHTQARRHLRRYFCRLFGV